MSPEPDTDQVSCSDTFEPLSEDVGKTDVLPEAAADTEKPVEECNQTEMLAPRKQRERRNKSPTATLTLLESFAAPLSPASSSSTSLFSSSADATFEPSIDMMVNDFDDEQTLNEEEALAAMEQQDPHDEIATLKEESEMPLEELLAKYCAAPPPPLCIEPPRKKVKRSSSGIKHSKQKKCNSDAASASAAPIVSEEPQITSECTELANTANDVIVIESGDEEAANADLTSPITAQQTEDENVVNATLISTPEANNAPEDECMENVEPIKPHRSHLLDLYPEQNFVSEGGKEMPLDVLYDEDDYEDGNDVEDDDIDSDYVKKTIMVGSSYQAAIPDGLSQYGDVLPYENEDKLIWEPSQVSERQVEEYLLKARDIKPSLLDNDEESGEAIRHNQTVTVDTVAPPTLLNGTHNGEIVETNETTPTSSTDEGQISTTVPATENDLSGVIKDNEQALHLLVQCGYDFKEALRRKRLNALPLTGSMSLWSEDECHKFEEGIQKFGKDFLKIRQNQVRTRTMRELVQFYYLWKKSDRRDHNFANSDTVDHMDIYLNEGGDFNPNAAANGATTTGNTSSVSTSSTPPLNARRNNACNQKNFSIMMTGSNASLATSLQHNAGNSKVTSSRKQRSGVMAGGGSTTGLLTVSSCNESSIPQSISLSVAHTK